MPQAPRTNADASSTARTASFDGLPVQWCCAIDANPAATERPNKVQIRRGRPELCSARPNMRPTVAMPRTARIVGENASGRPILSTANTQPNATRRAYAGMPEIVPSRADAPTAGSCPVGRAADWPTPTRVCGWSCNIADCRAEPTGQAAPAVRHHARRAADPSCGPPASETPRSGGSRAGTQGSGRDARRRRPPWADVRRRWPSCVGPARAPPCRREPPRAPPPSQPGESPGPRSRPCRPAPPASVSRTG